MSMFSALAASASGAQLANTWLTTISHNIANSSTVRPDGYEPFRAQQITAASAAGLGGVRVTGVVDKAGTPDRVYDPGNPLADEEGFVTRPVVDLTEELTGLMVAQRLYSANLAAHSQVRDAYRAALSIGRS